MGKAKAKLEALVKLEPDEPGYRQRLARSLFKLGNPKEALQTLQAMAVDVSPIKALSPEITLAAFYKADGDKANAEKWIMVAQKKGADKTSESQLGLCNWYYDQNEMDKAKQHLDAALKLDPNNVDAKVFQGAIARNQRDLKTAETVLVDVHSWKPVVIEAIMQLALVLLDKSDDISHKRALELAEIGVKINPTSPATIGTLAMASYRAGKLPEAERNFAALMGGGRVSNDVLYQLACFSNDQGRNVSRPKIC